MTHRKMVETVTIEDGYWVSRTPDIGGAVVAPTLARLKASVAHGAEFIFEGEEVEISYVYDLPAEVVAAAEAETDRPEESTSPGSRRRRRDAVRARLTKLIVGDVTEDDVDEVMPSPQAPRQLRPA